MVIGLSVSACASVPLPELSTKEKQILFIKDHVPEDSYKCAYLGIIEYQQEDNPGEIGCAVHERQAWAFIHKAAAKNANLVVATFSRTSKGYESKKDLDGDSPSCINQAKIFRCPSASLASLRKYE